MDSKSRLVDEKRILNDLRGTFRLLNDLTGYRYKTADVKKERQKIHEFIDMIFAHPYSSGHVSKATQKSTSENFARQSAKALSRTGSAPYFSVPERVRQICQELANENKIIKREDILRVAGERGINKSSVLPADYCDNTETAKWSRHSFLHQIGRGRYILN
jgi:hypothetical protein